jgi:hypothetical protein
MSSTNRSAVSRSAASRKRRPSSMTIIVMEMKAFSSSMDQTLYSTD